MAATVRDEFNEVTRRTLQQRAGNRCSNPNCGALTSGPNTEESRATIIGVAAHITAAAGNGPRYDPELSPQERKNIENGIWLCQNCGKLIDSDPQRFTVELLRKWKEEAEAKAYNEVKAGFEKSPAKKKLDCPYCGTEIKYGLKICKGCQAEIVYGATKSEIKWARRIGLIGTYLFFHLLAVAISELGTVRVFV